MFIFKETPLPLVVEITPQIFPDSRGFFLETFNTQEFKKAGIGSVFVQDNQSVSKKGVLRGMHYQTGPTAQGKLVRVTLGSVFDVAVDVRRESHYFGKWYGVVLSKENMKMLWVPPGFAHGFLSLEEGTTFQYKCTTPYSSAHEGGFVWDDTTVSIKWPLDQFRIGEPIISEKDKNLPPL